MNKLVNYLKSVRAELKNVVWPTKKTTINHTLLVIGISIVVALFFFALDSLFVRILGNFIN